MSKKANSPDRFTLADGHFHFVDFLHMDTVQCLIGDREVFGKVPVNFSGTVDPFLTQDRLGLIGEYGSILFHVVTNSRLRAWGRGTSFGQGSGSEKEVIKSSKKNSIQDFNRDAE